MRHRLLFLALLTVLPWPAWAQLPVGAQFQVNPYTTGGQAHPVVNQPGPGNGVFGQRFGTSGTRLGTERPAATSVPGSSSRSTARACACSRSC
jgi:hypothetical protein